MPDTSKAKLPSNLPECDCFNTDDAYTWARCAAIGGSASTMGRMFHELVVQNEFCAKAMPCMLETALITILSYMARAEGPALEYGTIEIERESLRLLAGLEARVVARLQETYAAGREIGLNEANVRAMREAEQETKQ